MPPAQRNTKAPVVDDRVTKRKVTMRSVVVDPGWNPDEHDGAIRTITAEAVDYVRPDILDAYLADARTRWQSVTVGDVDAGPAGYDGPTFVPHGVTVRDPDGSDRFVPFPHALAGSYYPATDCKDCKHAPEGARVVREG